MTTIICMGLLLLFLGFAVLYRDKIGEKAGFFDIDSTNCMRGIWCIVVVLVHIPADYQNPIQDMLGSFAYIGVTFFFMTSSYGLLLGAKANPEKVSSGFWRRRLPKLLIPMALVNILRATATFFGSGEFTPWGFLLITGFVRQLLLFYFVFWLVFKFTPAKMTLNAKCAILCACVLIFSIVIYCWKSNPLFAWPVESFGFVYGILLAIYKEKFTALAKEKWLLKTAVTCGLALVFGVAYLKFKNVVFFGDYLLRIALGIAILLFILLLTVKLKFGNKISHFLGNISYEIYLLHDVVFLILTAFYAKMNSGIFVLTSILLTVVLSIVVSKLSKVLLALARKKDNRVDLWQKN